MRRWEINFCVLGGATMKFLSGSRVAIAHPDGPPLIVDVLTGEAWWLSPKGNPGDLLVSLHDGRIVGRVGN